MNFVSIGGIIVNAILAVVGISWIVLVIVETNRPDSVVNKIVQSESTHQSLAAKKKQQRRMKSRHRSKITKVSDDSSSAESSSTASQSSRASLKKQKSVKRHVLTAQDPQTAKNEALGVVQQTVGKLKHIIVQENKDTRREDALDLQSQWQSEESGSELENGLYRDTYYLGGADVLGNGDIGSDTSPHSEPEQAVTMRRRQVRPKTRHQKRNVFDSTSSEESPDEARKVRLQFTRTQPNNSCCPAITSRNEAANAIGLVSPVVIGICGCCVVIVAYSLMVVFAVDRDTVMFDVHEHLAMIFVTGMFATFQIHPWHILLCMFHNSLVHGPGAGKNNKKSTTSSKGSCGCRRRKQPLKTSMVTSVSMYWSIGLVIVWWVLILIVSIVWMVKDASDGTFAIASDEFIALAVCIAVPVLFTYAGMLWIAHRCWVDEGWKIAMCLYHNHDDYELLRKQLLSCGIIEKDAPNASYHRYHRSSIRHWFINGPQSFSATEFASVYAWSVVALYNVWLILAILMIALWTRDIGDMELVLALSGVLLVTSLMFSGIFVLSPFLRKLV